MKWANLTVAAILTTVAAAAAGCQADQASGGTESHAGGEPTLGGQTNKSDPRTLDPNGSGSRDSTLPLGELH